MVNTILLLVAYDNTMKMSMKMSMKRFIDNIYAIDIDSIKEVKKLLKNINLQLKDSDEKEKFKLFNEDYDYEEFIKLVSILGMYLTEEFDRNYIINAYKASFDINEYSALGEDRSEIEYYIDSFPAEEKLNLKTILSQGYEYAEVLENVFGEESFIYEF